jgi:hypothetical protein
MLQLANAIAAHQPARERSLDLARVKDHLLRLFKDLASRFEVPFSRADIQFIFAGYSWRSKDFRIWTIWYEPGKKLFHEREARSFCSRLRKAAFIGDWAKQVRGALAKELSSAGPTVYLEPLRVLADFLESAKPEDSIGGAPQVVRISQHMTTRPLCVRWNGGDTLFGRPLFTYENTDYWIVDPLTGRFFMPRKFGYRANDADADVVMPEGGAPTSEG